MDDIMILIIAMSLTLQQIVDFPLAKKDELIESANKSCDDLIERSKSGNW